MENWESNVRKVIPYVAGEQPQTTDVVKINTNENPYPPAPRVSEILKQYDCDRMRLYPDTDSTCLIKALSDFYKIDKSQIFVGVGSDDVISLAFLTCFNSRKPVLFPDVTYSFYDVWAKLYNIPYQQIPLTDDFRINKNDYIGKHCGGIIFPNPNAPTGVFESVSMIEEIVEANPNVVVVIDEAYIDFGGESCLPLIAKYDNLLITQTFSKSRSMAGMRIGVAFGSKKLIKYLNDVKFSINSYTMNPITQLCGAEAVKDNNYFYATLNKVIKTREETKTKLKNLGFTMTNSMTNFLFVSHKTVDANTIFEELKKRRIFVRHWNSPRIKNYLRITIGTDEQMDKLVKALEGIINEKG